MLSAVLKKPRHNFCWVVKSFPTEGKEVIWVNKENLRHLEGLGVPIRIPYYILKSTGITEAQREEIEKRIETENEGYSVESFEKILEEDKKSEDSDLIELAEITSQFTKAIEDSKAIPGNKIAVIVDAMKLYMAARRPEPEVSIDYNVSVKRVEEYFEKLHEGVPCFVKLRDRMENKIVFLGNNKKEAIKYAKQILLRTDPYINEYYSYKDLAMMKMHSIREEIEKLEKDDKIPDDLKREEIQKKEIEYKNTESDPINGVDFNAREKVIQRMSAEGYFSRPVFKRQIPGQSFVFCHMYHNKMNGYFLFNREGDESGVVHFPAEEHTYYQNYGTSVSELES